MKTTSIKFFYNGIKLNGENKLLKCFYSIDNSTAESGPCVTIYARGYDDLPRDVFPVENDTDIYTDYFDSDRATLTPAHPLYKYARAAAIKADLRDSVPYLEKLERTLSSGNLAPWQNADALKIDADSRRAKIEQYRAELEQLPKTHPTAADLAEIDAMKTAAENARRAREQAEQLEAREKTLRQRAEGRAYIEGYTAGGRVVSVNFAPWLDDYARRKAEQRAAEDQAARERFEETLAMLEMLTDEQLEAAIFSIDPNDAENADIARFFFQQLAKRDKSRAVEVLRRWQSQS